MIDRQPKDEDPYSAQGRVEEAQALSLAAETARQLAEEKNTELSRMVTESNEQIKQLQRQLTQLHATSKSRLEQLADDSRQRHELWEKAQQRIVELELESQNNRRLQAEKDAASRKNLAAVVRALDEQIHKVSQQTARVEEFERLLQEQTQQADLQRRELEEAHLRESGRQAARISELEHLLREQTKLAADQKGELEDYQLALSTSEDQIQFIEGELEDREQIVDSLHSQLSSYLDKLRQAQGKLYSVGEAVDKRNQWLRQLQEQNRNLSAKCRNWEQLCLQAQQQKKQVEGELEKVATQLEELRWEHGETQINLEDSQNMVTNLQDQLSSQLPRAHQHFLELQAKYRQACTHLVEFEARMQEIQAASEPPHSQ